MFVLSLRNKSANMAKELIEADIRDLIMDYIKGDFTSLKRLSKLSGIAYGTLYSCFIEKRFNLNEENLKTINEVLGTDFKNNKD